MRWFWRRRDPHDWILAQQRRKEREESRPWQRVWLYNVAILLGMWLFGVGVLSLGGGAPDENLSVGQLAPRTVVAKVEFKCRDLSRTELTRQRAGESAVPVFRLLTAPRDDAWRMVDKVAERAISARVGRTPAEEAPPAPAPAVEPPQEADGAVVAEAEPESAETPTAKPKGKKKEPGKGTEAQAAPEPVAAAPAADPEPVPVPQAEQPVVPMAQPGPPVDSPKVLASLQETADLMDLRVSGEDLAHIFPAGQEREIAEEIKAAVAKILRQGVVSDTELEFVGKRLAASPSVDIESAGDAESDGEVRRVATAELMRVATAKERFAEMVRPGLEDRGVANPEAVSRAMAASLVRASLKYDQERSEERRTTAAGNVKDVYMKVYPGMTIMEEHTPVTVQGIEMLAAYNRRLAELEGPGERARRRTGDYLMMLVVLIACVGWLRSVQPGVYSKTRRKWLLVLLGVLALGLELMYHRLSTVHGTLPGWVVPYALPLTLTPMIAVLMLGPEAGLASGLWVSLSSALIFGRSFEFMFIGIAGSVTAVALLRSNVRRRSQLMRAGLVVGCVNTLVAIVMALLNGHSAATFRGDVIASFASGLVAAVVVSVLLPVLEWAFRHTTDISLLELTDMAHPLLQRLSLEAPGTYHHSLMVAAIGQAAADRIGADGLVVSVCASFHDIGKLAKPEFFTENQRGGENPHDNLSPSMSALLIQSHVKEGVTLAKRYRLPEVVCDAIRIHHGTSRISYFYQLACNNLKASGLPEDPGLEASFRYEGPRPWTREQAILTLADTVEAASRSLEKITPSRISEMVDRLIRAKLLDGQLDESPLTLAELRTVRDSFVFTLTNILHGRSAYPNANPVGAAGEGSAPEAAAGEAGSASGEGAGGAATANGSGVGTARE